MKIFETTDLATRFQRYKLYSVFKYLETLLKSLDIPDVNGIPIQSIADQNFTDLGDGNCVIDVDTLKDTVRIGGEENPVYLRKGPVSGKLEWSQDGETWTAIDQPTWTDRDALWQAIDMYLLHERIAGASQIEVAGGILYAFSNSFDIIAGSSNNAELGGGLLYPITSTSPMTAVLTACACRHAFSKVRLVIEYGFNDGYQIDVDLTVSGSFDIMSTWQPFALALDNVTCFNREDGNDIIIAKTFEVTPAGSPPFLLLPKIEISGSELVNYVRGCMISLIP